MPKGELDLSEFDAEVQGPGYKCWAAKMTPDQTEKVLAAHAAGHAGSTISRVVKKWGINANSTAVNRHLRGGCSCQN